MTEVGKRTALIQSKALAGETSTAIVVSFDSKWLGVVRGNKITKVLRKRVPLSSRPEWMYIYINSPAGALVARARVADIGVAKQSDALSLQQQLCLTDAEIRSYYGRAESVGIYSLKSIEVSDHPLSLAFLRERLTFYPPQSFFFLSKEAMKLIDTWAVFSAKTAGTHVQH